MPLYSPPGTLGVTTATSLALGGATIGTNALAVTGTQTNVAAANTNALFAVSSGATGISQIILQNLTASGTQIAGIGFQVSTTGEALGAVPKAGIFLVRNAGNGGGYFYMAANGAADSAAVSAADAFLSFYAVSGGYTQILKNGLGLGGAYNTLSPTLLTSPGAATFQFGAADAAVAVAQTLRVQSVVAGTAAANGANFTIIGSLPTGTGTSGDIIFKTGVKTGSGTTQGTPTTALTIKGETQAVTIASGKALVLGNAATTGLVAGVEAALTNATIVITDAAGQAYRIPCII